MCIHQILLRFCGPFAHFRSIVHNKIVHISFACPLFAQFYCVFRCILAHLHNIPMQYIVYISILPNNIVYFLFSLAFCTMSLCKILHFFSFCTLLLCNLHTFLFVCTISLCIFPISFMYCIVLLCALSLFHF